MEDKIEETTADFQPANCREDFPALKQKIGEYPLAYFDGPGGSQVPSAVIEAVKWYYETCNSNAHGKFITSQRSDRVLQETREEVACFLNAPGGRNISFGANMTTLNFFLSHALLRRLQPEDEIVITQLDHEANRGPWLNLRRYGVVIREVAVQPDGTLDYDDLVAKVGDRTRLVAVGWASNALGTVNNLSLIRDISRKHGARMLVDAVHYAPHFPIDFSSSGADFLLCSAYKFYGPHVGILCTRSHLLDRLDTDRLITQSPHSPYRIETGTLNHAAIAGVGAAIRYLAQLGEGATLREQIESAMTAISLHEQKLARRLYQGLREMSHIRLFGPPVGADLDRAPTVAFRVEGMAPADVARRLGNLGLLVWDGHFYAARIVEVLGLAETGGLVRVGMSLYNTAEEVERLLRALRSIGTLAQSE
jgi:cysteine desulfurase family protein (TIGR01976 family)